MKNIPFHRIIRMQITSISFVSTPQLCPPLSLPCPPQGRPGQSKILEDYKTSHHHHHHHHEQQVQRDGLVRGGPSPGHPGAPFVSDELPREMLHQMHWGTAGRRLSKVQRVHPMKSWIFFPFTFYKTINL